MPIDTPVTNLLIILLNGILMLQLLRPLMRNHRLACVLSALVMTTPARMELVRGSSSAESLLGVTFILASSLCWLRVDRTDRSERWGIFWLILALSGRSVAVLLPALVVAFDLLVARKTFLEAISRQIVPTFFCVMLILINRNAEVLIMGGVRNHLGISRWQLLAIDCTLLWQYGEMQITPQELGLLTAPLVPGPGLLVLAGVLMWIAMACLLWKLSRSQLLATGMELVWVFLFAPILDLLPQSGPMIVVRPQPQPNLLDSFTDRSHCAS